MWDTVFLIWCFVHPACIEGFMLAMFGEWWKWILLVFWLVIAVYLMWMIRRKRIDNEKYL